MTYKAQERTKAESLISAGFFKDCGQGVYYGKPRRFVLSQPRLNLWAGIREDALRYFHDNDISWHQGNGGEPTGHLLSSQVACVNHLYYLRQRKDLADAVVTGVGFGMTEAAMLDTGYVEFEVIGNGPYLNERSWTRGANSTSVDAVMLGVDEKGKRTLVLIEWKYTESYGCSHLYCPARARVYDSLIMDPGSPIEVEASEYLYYEPFYQLMRQTLLGWKMVQNGDYGASGFIHVHVIPEGNKKLRDSVPSPDLRSENMSAAWRSVLKDPESYIVVTPSEVLAAVASTHDSRAFLYYLKERYGLAMEI